MDFLKQLQPNSSSMTSEIKPGMAHALLLLLISGAIALVVNPLVLTLVKWFPVLFNWQMTISYILIYGSLLVIAMKIWSIQRFEVNRVSLRVYLLILPAIPAMTLISEGIVGLLPMPDWMARIFEELIKFNLPGYLAIGVAAPLLEELIFRGVILRGFLKRYSPQRAVLFSALIFGIAHMNPWQFIPATFIGIAMGWLYYQTKSIWPGLFIHFVNNTFSFYLGYTYADVHITFYKLIDNWLIYSALMALSVLTCWVVYLSLARYFKSKISEQIEFSSVNKI